MRAAPGERWHALAGSLKVTGNFERCVFALRQPTNRVVPRRVTARIPADRQRFKGRGKEGTLHASSFVSCRRRDHHPPPLMGNKPTGARHRQHSRPAGAAEAAAGPAPSPTLIDTSLRDVLASGDFAALQHTYLALLPRDLLMEVRASLHHNPRRTIDICSMAPGLCLCRLCLSCVRTIC